MYKGYGNASNNNYSPKSTPPGSRKKNNLNHLNYTYYIGVDYNKANIKTKHEKLIFGDSNKSIEANELIDDLDDNISAVLGMRPHPNMGIEAFYNRVAKKNEVEKGNTTYSAKYHAFGVDLIGYLPVTNYLDFVAVAGIGQYYFESSASYPDAAAEDAFGRTLAFRAGAGLQINLRSGLIIRSMYRYVHIDNMNIQILQEFSLGVRIAF
jgi:opacity protein-like surface antigen